MSLSSRSLFISNKSEPDNYSKFNSLLEKIIEILEPNSSEEEKEDDIVEKQEEKNRNELAGLLKSLGKINQKIKENNLKKIYQIFLKSNSNLMNFSSILLLHTNFNIIISDFNITSLIDSDIKKGILTFEAFIHGSIRIIADAESDSDPEQEPMEEHRDEEKKRLPIKDSFPDIDFLLNSDFTSDDKRLQSDKDLLNRDSIMGDITESNPDSILGDKVVSKSESIVDDKSISDPESKSEFKPDDEIDSFIISAFLENIAQLDIEEKGKSSSRLIIDYHANLYEYPKKHALEKLTPDRVLTVGDMHGNALKLIYILIRHQVLDIDESQYKELIRIYDTPVPQRAEKKSNIDPEFDLRLKMYANNMKQFAKIINDAFNKVDTKKVGRLRFLGDLISERGRNDYFTFKMIEWFFIKNIARILWSNHDYDALIHIYNLSNPDKKINPWFLEEHSHFKQSLLNLIELIELKVVRLDWINHVIQNCYKPLLQLISYAREEGYHGKKHLTIYTHAPTKFTHSLQRAITHFMIKQNISEPSLSNIIHAIDAINRKLVESKELTNPQFRPAIEPFINDRLAALVSENSDELKTMFPSIISDYFTTFIAGHDFPLKNYKTIDSSIVSTNDEFEEKIRFRDDLENTCSLDNFFGKNLEHSKKGVYFSRLSNEPPSLQLMLYIETILKEIQNLLIIPELSQPLMDAFSLYEKNNDHKAFQKNWRDAADKTLLTLKKSEHHSPLVSLSVYPALSKLPSLQLTELLKETDKQISTFMTELISDSDDAEYKKSDDFDAPSIKVS